MRPRLSLLLALCLSLALIAGWNGLESARALAAKMEKSVAGALSGQHIAFPMAVASSSCYTWDFLNNSGDDATGLVIHLKGIPAVSNVYTGVLDPFGAPDPSSGYNAITDVYSLIFGGGTVYNGDKAEIGFCTGSASVRLDTTQPAYYWVVGGNPTTPAPLFAGMDFDWVDPNHIQAHLYNEQSTPLIAYSFLVLAPDAPLSMDDLNNDTASTLPVASDLITSTLALAGGGSIAFDIFLDQGGVRLQSGAPLILEASLAADDDPGNTIHMLVQTSEPFSTLYLPITTR